MEGPQKKVLILSYYWPPSGGSGVQRWLKFTKYLPYKNWKPIVYTPSNPEIPIADPSLYKDINKDVEVLKRSIWEPYSFYKRFIGLKKQDKIQTGFMSDKKKNGLLEKIAVWIRGNLFIPDARRFWIKPSTKYLSEWLKDNPVDIIISSGPPHSMHLIALELKKKFNIPWIADFRDPWTKIDFYNELKLSKWADEKHHKLEKMVIEHADQLIVVGPSMKADFESMTSTPIEVITNGYDAEDFDTLPSPKDTRFSIVHIGSMVPSRNPKMLFKVLSDLVVDDAGIENDLCIRLIGSVDHSIMETIQSFGLQSFVERVEYLPHDEVITEQKRAAVLLLVLNKTFSAKRIVTGKVFEYMAAKRPILTIGNVESDVSEILVNAQYDDVIDHDDAATMRTKIQDLYEKWRANKNQEIDSNPEKYSREFLTDDLIRLMEKHV